MKDDVLPIFEIIPRTFGRQFNLHYTYDNHIVVFSGKISETNLGFFYLLLTNANTKEID